MKKFMHDNSGEDEREQLEKDDRKRKKNMCDNFDKKILKKDNKRGKPKRDNLDDSEKEQLRKYEKEGKKFMCNNLDDEKKEH